MNRYSAHILVLPEDRANEEIANGFIENLNVNDRVIKIERPAGGWTKVISKFTDVHIAELRQFPKEMIVLIIDFDRREDRLSYVREQIPEDLKD